MTLEIAVCDGTTAVAALREGKLQEIVEDGLGAIVRGALGDLDGAQGIRDIRDRVGDLPQGGALLVCREDEIGV